jgi:MFS-type transporter involved in bile tolerance (Atg22 family)
LFQFFSYCYVSHSIPFSLSCYSSILYFILYIYLLHSFHESFNSAFYSALMIQRLMKNELKRLSKRPVAAYFTHCPCTCLEGLKEIYKTTNVRVT